MTALQIDHDITDTEMADAQSWRYKPITVNNRTLQSLARKPCQN